MPIFIVSGADLPLPQHGYFVNEDDGFEYIRKLEEKRQEANKVRGMKITPMYALVRIDAAIVYHTIPAVSTQPA